MPKHQALYPESFSPSARAFQHRLTVRLDEAQRRQFAKRESHVLRRILNLPGEYKDDFFSQAELARVYENLTE